jgi:orotidine-5'-phosphate decarboxylase
MMKQDPKIIIALDYSDAAFAFALLDQLDPAQCRVKIGKELFTSAGPAFVKEVVRRNFDVFLDLKFHDIPNTVAKACMAAAELGVWMINVHALGGRKMMEAAKNALESVQHKPYLIAVTILTSHSQEDLDAIGLPGSPEENVLKLVDLAHQAGLDGVVCSPMEVAKIRQRVGGEFLLVTPGVRPAGASLGDQVRVMTPLDALKAGASYLVIGRPITAADKPMDALLTIQKDIADF